MLVLVQDIEVPASLIGRLRRRSVLWICFLNLDKDRLVNQLSLKDLAGFGAVGSAGDRQYRIEFATREERSLIFDFTLAIVCRSGNEEGDIFDHPPEPSHGMTERDAPPIPLVMAHTQSEIRRLVSHPAQRRSKKGAGLIGDVSTATRCASFQRSNTAVDEDARTYPNGTLQTRLP